MQHCSGYGKRVKKIKSRAQVRKEEKRMGNT
jgi:hypothetical protein